MRKVNRYKRFVAILLLFSSIISCIPKQASAFVEGWTGSGGSGVNWLCGAREWPCFTITILDEEFDQEIQPMNMAGNPEQEMEKARAQIRNQFSRKLPDPPNRWDSPTQCRLFVMPKYLGKGNSLASSVKYINVYKYGLGYDVSLSADESYKYMYKLNSPVHNVPSKFEQIRNKTYELIKSNNYDSSNLVGVWGGGTTGGFSYGEAEEVLRYIFSSDTGIESRLAELTYSNYYDARPAESLTEDGQAWQKAAMVTLGMALYYASSADSTERAYFGQRIDDFLDNNEINKRQPFIIEVEPASVWVDMTGKHFVMNCGDLLDRMSSATWDSTNWGVRAHGWNSNDFDIFSLIEASWTAMLNKHAGTGRQAYQDFYYPQGSKQKDHFVYGWSLATGIWYGVEGNKVATAKGSSNGYITNFGFHDNMFGFLLAFNSSLVAEVKAVKGSQDIEKEGDDLTTISSSQPVIGENVKITLRSNSTPDEIKTWKDRYESTKPNFIVAAEIKKTEGPQTAITPLSELPNSDMDRTPFSYDELIQFLEGTLTFDYEDNLSTTPIGNDEVIQNKYKSRVWIIEEKELATNKWVELNPNDGETFKNFKREPLRPMYTSSPVYYSEIKNNEPEDEEWEAMAGVPTTERLYFSSGGSEFIVDVELEYVPDQTTTRNYTVNFTPTACDLNGTIPCTAVSCPGHGEDKTTCDHHGCSRSQHQTCASPHYVTSSPISWTQSIKYDYMRMLRCQVWKIESSKVDGMRKITRADDEITATIQTGDPTAFWNVAKSNDARGGRLVYSLEPDQLDNVVWTIPTSPSCSNHQALDAQRVESEFKSKTNQATVVSDFLILQTNAGDQSVFYFDRKSNIVRCDTDFEFQKSSEDEMWKNNPKASAEWEEDHITVSSYNGKYKNVDSKYKSKGKASTVTTAFDSASYGQVMNRPDRPGNQMLLYKQFEQDRYNENGLYKTGHAYTFYKHIVDEGKPSMIYTDTQEAQDKFGDKGLMYESTYSPSHSKVNDIVVHNPVSSEKAMVIPLPDERDQRTENSKPALREPTQDAVEYIDVLPDDYMNNIVFNGYARYMNSKQQPLGWTLQGDINNSDFGQTTSNVIQDDSTAWARDKDKYWDGVQRSFYINNKTSTTSYFQQEFSIEQGKTYLFKGTKKASNNAHFGIQFIDENGTEKSYTTTYDTARVTAPTGSSKVRLFIVNQGSGEARFDNIQFYCESNQGKFTENDSTALDWKVVRNPLYHSHAESGCTKLIKYVCNNLPLNSGGTLEYEWYNSYHDEYIWYPSNTGHEYDYCSNHRSSPTGRTRMGGNPTAHVHTSACLASEYSTMLNWDFRNGLNGFTKGTAYRLSHSNNVMNVSIDTRDTYIYSPSNIDIDTGNVSTIEITVKNNSSGSEGQIYFATSNSNAFSESQVVHFTMSTNDSNFQTYRIKMNNHNRWTGTLKKLRFDLANGTSKGNYEVSSIRLLNGSGQAVADEWSCGLLDTSKDDKILNKCNNSLNAGYESYWYIAHGSGCTYDGETHKSTTMSPCSVCNHTCYDSRREVSGYTRHEHTDDCYTFVQGQQKEIMGWYPASQQPVKNAQPWEYIQKIKEPTPNKEVQTPQGTFKPGNFINIDYPFQIYFPNEGDFEGTNELGIKKTTKNRGYGFEDGMDTTKWTHSKYVIFEFDVIFKGKLYGAGERIYLDVNEDTFDFYCPLENKEYLQSGVTFVSIADNSKYKQVDNDETTNKLRYGSKLQAKHSATKVYFIDVVGRIGNMSIQDTGDFRFANFFKKSFNNGEWLIDNIVPTVDIGSQNNIVGDQVDIRGHNADKDTKYTNTYGMESYKEQQAYPFPLNPVYNNIEALKRQPLRIGYPTYMDVDTIGDYTMGRVQILPYYYALNLTTGKIDPVDIYMSVNGSYKLINKHNKLQADGTINEDEIYNNKVFLNWSEESIRRNYTGTQANNSQDGADFYNQRYTYADVNGYEGDPTEKAETPYGKYYVMGNSNALLLTPRARSFIGTQFTYGENKNPGRRVNPLDYVIQGQRWHFTLSLPSTAVAVKADRQPTSANIDEIKNNNHVILTAVDIKAMGTQYTLQGDTKNNQITIQTVKPDGTITSKDYPVGSIPHKIVTVNSANKTSRDDLAVSGTH